MWTWSDTRPRPNQKRHPLDAYQMPERLRGGETVRGWWTRLSARLKDFWSTEPDPDSECPEAILAWALAAVIVWAVLLTILVFA